MKGIILAGGSGTRLYPITKGMCKQLLPIYDKPMIYYPLSILMLAEIKEILIISTPKDISRFEDILKDGSALGLNIKYAIQLEPKGLAEAFMIGKEFIGNDSVVMVLGDNIFYGDGLKRKMLRAISNAEEGIATVFSYYVKKPERFGVVEFDKDGNVISIEEKPKYPKSNYIVTGLYFYDNKVVEYVEQLKPSARDELEITDINKIYLQNNTLKVEFLGRGYNWLDTGTFESLNEASNFVKTVQCNGQMIGCLEEIAYYNGWITKEKLEEFGRKFKHNSYGKYLLKLARENINVNPVRIFSKENDV